MRKFSINRRFKKGAASFYIVAISTLILVIIAASFAAVIISEVTRTSNDDLSQSAYDSALAGIEDAKLAFYNYQQCKNGKVTTLEGGMPCEDLVNAIESGNSDCDLVARALGRRVETKDGGEEMGVLVQEGNTNGNDMQQYYTCVKIAAITDDYLGELDSDDPEHSVRIRFFGDEGVEDHAKYVQLSWHSTSKSSDSSKASDRFEFMDRVGGSILGSSKSTPAVVSLTMIQTDSVFSLSDFDMTKNGTRTDRGTLYFVPVEQSVDDAENYHASVGYAGEIESNAFAKSNDKMIKNKPYTVLCRLNQSEDYACSVRVEIPKPVNSDNRNADTFVFSVALPYGEPKTDYQLEFIDDNGNPMKLDGVQVSIDSTGRANDLFRRVDTRLEPADAAYPYPIYGIEALNPDGNSGIEKNFDTTCEYNFDDKTCW